MKTINSLEQIKLLIQQKEEEQINLGIDLREHFKRTTDSLKPVNIIIDTIKDVFTSKSLKEEVVNSTMSFAAGYLSKKLFIGQSKKNKVIKNGEIVEKIVAIEVKNNAENIKSFYRSLVYPKQNN